MHTTAKSRSTNKDEICSGCASCQAAATELVVELILQTTCSHKGYDGDLTKAELLHISNTLQTMVRTWYPSSLSTVWFFPCLAGGTHTHTHNDADSTFADRASSSGHQGSPGRSCCLHTSHHVDLECAVSPFDQPVQGTKNWAYLSAAEILVHASAQTGHKLSCARRALHLHDVRSTSRPRQQPGGKISQPVADPKATRQQRIFPGPAPLGSKWSVQRPGSTIPMKSHVRTNKRWT